MSSGKNSISVSISGRSIARSRLLKYWGLSFAWSVGFGELFLSGVIDGNSAPFQFFLPIVVYYLVLCFLFGLLTTKVSTRWCMLIFLMYGLLAERFVFGNIQGLEDYPAIIFFGALYLVLFGLPLWIINHFEIRPLHTGKNNSMTHKE